MWETFLLCMQQSISHWLHLFWFLLAIFEPNRKELEDEDPPYIWNRKHFRIHIECPFSHCRLAWWFDCNQVLCNKPNFCFIQCTVCREPCYIALCKLLWMSRVDDKDTRPAGILRSNSRLLRLSIWHFPLSNSCRMNGHN